MAKAKKASYKTACERALARGNSNGFTDGCARRYPELAKAAGIAEAAQTKRRKKRSAQDVPQACRTLLSEEMKAGRRKTALRKYWECRRQHEQKDG